MDEIPMEAEYRFAIIWREIFRGIFSNIGRVVALANCSNPETGKYYESVLAQHLGHKEADRCMRIAHELLWADWIRGSLQQQHADILLYSRDISTSIRDVLSHWIQTLPVLSLCPISATQESRALFASNLKLFLSLQIRQSDDAAMANVIEEKFFTAALDQVVCSVRKRYYDPNLSLKGLSHDLKVSERHLGRLVKEFLGQPFRQYLRSMRVNEAARLLVDTTDDVKMIAGKVGYSDPSHFCRDFRMLTGCTPLEFRRKQDRKPMSDLLYRKSVLSY